MAALNLKKQEKRQCVPEDGDVEKLTGCARPMPSRGDSRTSGDRIEETIAMGKRYFVM